MDTAASLLVDKVAKAIATANEDDVRHGYDMLARAAIEAIAPALAQQAYDAALYSGCPADAIAEEIRDQVLYRAGLGPLAQVSEANGNP